MEGMGQLGYMIQFLLYYVDGLMFDNMFFGDVVLLQDMFVSMMCDWGGFLFDFEGVYDQSF